MRTAKLPNGTEVQLDDEPTLFSRLLVLAARSSWHPNYAAEKVFQALAPKSYDYLLGHLDQDNQARWEAIRESFIDRYGYSLLSKEDGE